MTRENREAHVTAELQRGRASLRAAIELQRLGLHHDAVSRAYYAALHFALAVLLTEGVEPKSHAGVSGMLGLHFVRTGRLPPQRAKELSRLEQFRSEADYNRFFVFDEASAQEEVEVAQSFCAEIESWLSMGGWTSGT